MSTASAEEPRLPAGIVHNQGLPPLLPYSLKDRDGLTRAFDALQAEGRARPGTRRGGDAWFSAAWLANTMLGRPKDALALYATAEAAYPTNDPMRGIVLVRHAAAELGRGHTPAARKLLERAIPWMDAVPPPDLEGDDEHRWQLLARLHHEEFRPLVARLHAKEGDLRTAAETQARLLADERASLSSDRRGRMQEQLARWWLGAGERERALDAIDVAIEHAGDDPREAERRYWRLHARHGLVDAEGAPTMPTTWPGEAFERDVHAFLHAMQGLRGASTAYLSLGSAAYVSDRKAIALAIYQAALRDPELLARARGDATIWRGLLVGYAAALDLGELDEAERILDAVARIAGAAVTDLDAMRVAIAEARAEPETRRKEPAVPPVADTETRERAGIRPASRDAAPDRRPSPATDEDDDVPVWIVVVLVAMGFVIAFRRRRRGD